MVESWVASKEQLQSLLEKSAERTWAAEIIRVIAIVISRGRVL